MRGEDVVAGFIQINLPRLTQTLHNYLIECLLEGVKEEDTQKRLCSDTAMAKQSTECEAVVALKLF